LEGKGERAENIGCWKVLENSAENQGGNTVVPLLMINNYQAADLKSNSDESGMRIPLFFALSQAVFLYK
jgi:hypothetical protein